MRYKNNEIQSSNGSKRLNYTGYLNLTTMNVHHNYYKDTINAAIFIESLKIIKASYKDKATVFIFLDNTGYHKNKESSKNILHKNNRSFL